MFHERIAQEMEKLNEKDFIEPESIPEEGEHFIGLLPDELKRLYAVWRKRENSMHKLAADALFAAASIVADSGLIRDSESCKKLDKDIKSMEAKVALLHEEEEALRSMFWVSVRDCFPELGAKTIGLRKGFKVVQLNGKCPVCGEVH